MYTGYITSAEYVNLYRGEVIDPDIFDRIALRASDALDRITMNRVRLTGLSNYDDATQELIKLATCALAEGIAIVHRETGGTGVVAGSEKIGGYNYALEPGSLDKVQAAASQKAQDYLLFTGLVYRGLESICTQ